ncbi:MAG: Ldh family oxidoreductase [Pseudomonadota bacterium]
MTLSVAEAHELVVQTLVRCRTAHSNAASVADALIAAERAGQVGHGLRRVPSYAGQALSGKVDGQAQASADQHKPGALMVDAGHGFAYPALALAMDWLPEAAKTQGIAVAGITRSHHAGVAGWFVERLAADGLVALMFANTPAAMAPWGGARPLFGTNPIAFGAPIENAAPMVVDLSLSTVARGKIMAAAQKGEAIPGDWATDADGRPTTDPALALKGMMQPMGGAKGAALALMVEVLAAALVGANTGSEASDFFGAEGAPPGTGQLLLAIDPGAMGGSAGITRLAGLFQGNGDARLPGQRRQQIAARVDAEGIELDADLAKQIDALGR